MYSGSDHQRRSGRVPAAIAAGGILLGVGLLAVSLWRVAGSGQAWRTVVSSHELLQDLAVLAITGSLILWRPYYAAPDATPPRRLHATTLALSGVALVCAILAFMQRRA